MPLSAHAGGLSRYVITFLFAVLSCGLLVSAQSNTDSGGASAPFTTLTTSTITSITEVRSGNTHVPSTSLIQTAFIVTVTPSRANSLSGSSASQSFSSSVSASASASPSPKPISLDTRIDPAFGVLGGILILTGLPSAFLGHKNRWTSFFLMGFYTLSIVCAVLIIQFGVEAGEKDNRIPSKSLRGMFVLASVVAGVIGGGVTVFFWKGTRYFVGAMGGFTFGLWIECFRDGGLIDPIGFRYIMFIGCAVIGFTLCTIKRIHYYVVIVSTAFVGATSLMLGVDCFTTANLKEFYIWNLGFKGIFPKFTTIGMRFPVSQSMEIELGLIGAVAIMGIAVQLRVLKLLKRKLEEIAAESKRHDEAEEARAANRFDELDLERNQWEKDHPGMPAHQRKESGLSSLMPLMKHQEAAGMATPGTPGTPSTAILDGHRRTTSGLSDYMLDGRQSPGAIPTLDLGAGLQDDVPENYLVDGQHSKLAPSSAAELEELTRKEALLSEIQSLRKSIQGLKEDRASSSGSRRPSMSSKRTLSNDLLAASAIPNHIRNSTAGSRSRVQSMNIESLSEPQQPAARPTSAPLAEDWDAYVRDRKLLQPPSGVTPPISPTPRAAVSPAVLDALEARHRRERSVESPSARQGGSRSTSSNPEDIPLATFVKQHDRKQSSTRTPATILPPAKGHVLQQKPSSPRTHTYEELTARHREKMRELQGPLSSQEKERAQLEKAKERWNRSKENEREVVARRQAEKAKAKEAELRRSPDGQRKFDEGARVLSADKLANLSGPTGGSSRRQSVLKVEDWQTQRLSTDVGQTSALQKSASRPTPTSPQGKTLPAGARPRRGSNPMRDTVN